MQCIASVAAERNLARLSSLNAESNVSLPILQALRLSPRPSMASNADPAELSCYICAHMLDRVQHLLAANYHGMKLLSSGCAAHIEVHGSRCMS